MIKSMTGFASATGSYRPYAWAFEIRSVNGKGQDVRLRVPDWIDGLETALRAQMAKATARGNITLSLRVSREDSETAQQVNTAQLAAVLTALSQIESHAMDAGVSLAPSRAADILAMRGILEQATPEEDIAGLLEALLADFPKALAAFDAMRRSEGAALLEVLHGQLAEVADLTNIAKAQAETRKSDMAAALRRNLARVLDNTDGVDEDRVAQELALIAVKSDITEEIDRLIAHIEAAHALLSDGGPVGRKLDFLMQEFNREANTLCSKAQSTELTRTGLALKAVIDQMREQVQNVE